MKILLVNPRIEISLYTFSETVGITGRPAYMPNLALPTLAAMVPAGFETTCVDEQVESIEPYLKQKWDLVGITGYIIQNTRMCELGDQFRSRGNLVAIGGPFASCSPSAVRDHCDILFTGEAEVTWPKFLEDFQAGTHQTEYDAGGLVDFDLSPVPRLSVLKTDSYLAGAIQTSRGCPFKCEFCDVIVYLGRKQRHKTPEQVVKEAEQWYQAGARDVFLSDDNLTASRKKAAEIMGALAEWNATKFPRMSFSTQMSVDVVKATDLLDKCVEAGLHQAFLGIESPDEEALKVMDKRQNLIPDLSAGINEIQRRGIAVQAGIVTGFDTDTVESFDRTFQFLQGARIPMVLVNMLYALEGTPLEARLAREGRLLPGIVENACFETNIIPLKMTRDELRDGTLWLLNRLYSPGAFLERLLGLAEILPPAKETRGSSPRDLQTFANMSAWYKDRGPEYYRILKEGARAFAGKSNARSLGLCLLFYRHVVGVMEKQGLTITTAST